MKSAAMSQWTLRLALLAVAGTHGQAWSQQAATGAATAGDPLRISVDAGMGWTDNITQVASGGNGESMATAGLRMQGGVHRRRLDAVIDANLRYLDYLQNTYSGELTGRLDGSLDLSLVQDRLDWVVEEHYGQTSINLFSVPTPTNRESVNYLSTGPDVLMAFGDSGFARLFGRYSLVSYETSPLDNDRRQVGLQLGRRVSGASRLSLNVVGERVNYDSAQSTPDYDRGQVYASYEVRAARTRLQSDLGYTRISNVAYTNGGVSARLTVTRQVSPFSSLSIEGGRSVTDASDRFRNPDSGVNAAATSGSRTETSVPTADIFVNRYARAAWDFNRGRSGVTFALSYLNDNYNGASASDRHRSGADLNLRRQVSRALSLRLVSSYAAEHFRAANSNYGEWRAGLGIRVTPGRRGFVDFTADHFDRNADDPSRSYVENRLFLTLGYDFN